MIEIVEKKSRFLGYAYSGICASDIERILKDLSNEHKKATHICYAYNIITGGVSAKAFDDGEPSGTAGKPIFNVIEKKKLIDVLIVVVRYFGGIKLGAGGLVRAYSKCASECVKEILD